MLRCTEALRFGPYFLAGAMKGGSAPFLQRLSRVCVGRCLVTPSGLEDASNLTELWEGSEERGLR